MRAPLRVFFSAACTLVLIAGAGCIERIGYGRVTSASPERSIQDFVKNWRDFHVSYSGLHPGQPSGLMFDPRHDEKELVGKRWRPVRDRDTLEEIVMWLQQNDRYRPRLVRIVGPERVVYGYVYTGWNQVVARAIDTRSMYVLDLPTPLPENGEAQGRNRIGPP